jgi:hypothetical protein
LYLSFASSSSEIPVSRRPVIAQGVGTSKPPIGKTLEEARVPDCEPHVGKTPPAEVLHQPARPMGGQRFGARLATQMKRVAMKLDRW